MKSIYFSSEVEFPAVVLIFLELKSAYLCISQMEGIVFPAWSYYFYYPYSTSTEKNYIKNKNSMLY